MNYHDSSSDVNVVVSSGSLGLKSSSTLEKNSLHDWVEGIDVDECQNFNQLLMLKEQLEGARKKNVSSDDSESFQALFGLRKSKKKEQECTHSPKERKDFSKEIEELESLIGYPMTFVVFSSTKTPYTYGDLNSAIRRNFPSTICTKRSISGINSHDSSSDVDVVVFGGSLGLKSSSTPQKSSLHGWVEGMDVEECQNLNQLLMLKEQREGTRKKIVSTNDSESFKAFFL
ncbi:hypothetical protein H5410_036841 [Solanum commersonii]|uniref:Uncharacterized protein n=1 Tax=Solanum commersonii TaxID=4109 RepID=A0A9J5Y5F2_SOLCO|nr:hypothetical protein H5410_036841 [Solanum commersonii]